jgi:cysteine-rich repeat protein
MMRTIVWFGLALGLAAGCSLALFTDEPADGGDDATDTQGDADARDDTAAPDVRDDGAEAEIPEGGGDDADDAGEAEAEDDGFEVSPTCGNGSVETGEECDDRNLTPGDGCEDNCLFSCHLGSDCADGNDCTLDICEAGGNGRICTNDLVPEGADCDDGNPCTTGEACNATGLCTGGLPADPTTVCRPAVDLCDAIETCGGASTCPADAFEPSGHVCRARLGGACDYPETCTGSSVRCPADIAVPDGGPCGRSDTGVCCAGVCEDPGNCCTSDHCRCLGSTTEACAAFRTSADCLSHLPCAWDTAMNVCYGFHLCNAYAGGTTCPRVPNCTAIGSLRLCGTNHTCAAL